MEEIANERKKKNRLGKIFGLSIWMLLFTYEGSFMIQSLVIFAIIELFYIIKNFSKIKVNKTHKYLILLMVVFTLATTINLFTNPSNINIYRITGLIYFFLIVIWFIINTQFDYEAKTINYIINNYIIVMTIVSIVSIYYSVFKGVQGKIEFINFIGTVIDENYSSALIAISPIFLMTKIINAKNNQATIFSIIINCVLLVINIFALALIGSRASFLVTCVGIALTFVLNYYQKITFQKIISSIFIVIAIVYGFNVLMDHIPVWNYERYFKNSYIDKSNNTRLDLWKNAIRVVSDQPIFGFGFGVYNNENEKYRDLPSFYLTPDSAPAHQSYLDILVYGGITGFLIFILFLYHVIKKSIKRKYRIILPNVVTFFLITNIIGADKSVFFWNNLIIIYLIIQYIDKNDTAIECFK